MIWCDQCGKLTGGEFPYGSLLTKAWREFFDSGEAEQLMELPCPRCQGDAWMVNAWGSVHVLREAAALEPPYTRAWLVTARGAYPCLGQSLFG